MKTLKVDLLYSTTWYSQTNDISERSNQIAKITLRYYIATLNDVTLWSKILHRMTVSLNNSIKYSFITLTPTQVLYSFRTRETLDLLRLENPDAETPSDRSENAIVTAHSVTRSNTKAQQQQEPTSTFDAITTSPATPPPAAEAFTRPANMSEYRPDHINVKNTIAFAALRIKQYYDTRH